MNTKHFFNEGDLKQIKASDLKPGCVFYLKNDKGEFETCVVDLSWYPWPGQLEEYRQGLRKFSEEGRLFFRRDRPGVSFNGWDSLKV